MLENQIDLNKIKIRLNTIRNKATNNISFSSSETNPNYKETYLSPNLTALEQVHKNYKLNPENINIFKNRSIFAFDESTQNYKSLEGDLFFYSSSVIKLDKKYMFNIGISPYFLTSMKKFKESKDDCILYSKNPSEIRNYIMVREKIKQIESSVEGKSIIMIDGPLIGGNASHYYTTMDKKLRKNNCIPIYFIKNSNSRLFIDSTNNLNLNFNGDFHWAAKTIPTGTRSAFFKYQDKYNKENKKVFTYIKPLRGFPIRVEMHYDSFTQFNDEIKDIFDLISYLFIVQGDYTNPQIRPIAIAELYAKAGLNLINVPILLRRTGFQPTINQVRFG